MNNKAFEAESAPTQPKNSTGRMKRAFTSPVFNEEHESHEIWVKDYYTNRFELGVGERLAAEKKGPPTTVRRRSVLNTTFLRKQSLIPKIPEKYIGDKSKQFRYYNVLETKQLSDQAQEEIDQLIDKSEDKGYPKILIERSVFSQKTFDENFDAVLPPTKTWREVAHKRLSKCVCSGRCVKEFLFTMFPFINIMMNYSPREDLMGDVVSGLTVGIMHIPQGMAYGMLTSLPPVYGLYMSFFPVLVYFFFGSSKHVSMGTFAVACLMIGSAVSKGMNAMSGSLAATSNVVEYTSIIGNQSAAGNTTLSPTSGDADDAMSAEELDLRLQFAMSVTFTVGIIQLLMGVFRLGFITVYLSDPLISGFTTGAACHVFTSQIKHIFGVKTNRYSGAFKLIYTYRDFFTNIAMTNYVTVILSIVCIIVLYCTSRFINQNPKLKPKMFMPVPIELIVVVLGTVISYAIKLNENHNVVVVSDIPTGLPVPNLNCFTRIPAVISDAIALAIVIFAISISMGKLLAKKHDYEVDPNQELVAYGISTIISSFLSSPAPSASLSRSLVQERVGGKTQVAGLVSCCLLLVVLLAIGPYFSTLPNCVMASTVIVALDGLFAQVFTVPDLWYHRRWDFCVLASIIIVALRGMFLQVLDLKKLWHISLNDFFVWIVAFFATVILDVDLGLGAAVLFNIITVVVRSQRPYACLLGQIPGTDLYRDTQIYNEAKEIPGIKIFRFEHSLFFVNTEHFRTLLYKKTINPKFLKIAQKKREAKLHKQKKRGVIVGGEDLPDTSYPESLMNIEMQARTGESKAYANGDHPIEVAVKTKGSETKVMVVADNKPPCPPDVEFHTIILDCSPWSFVDSMGVKILASVICEYKGIGVNVIIANCKGCIREMFEKTKFYDTVDHSNIYVSVHDAVLHALNLESPAVIKQVEKSASSFQTSVSSDDRTSQKDGKMSSKTSRVEFTIDEEKDD